MAQLATAPTVDVGMLATAPTDEVFEALADPLGRQRSPMLKGALDAGGADPDNARLVIAVGSGWYDYRVWKRRARRLLL
jgi:hypothetical protein